MTTLIEEVLSAWRAGERVLVGTPEGHAKRASVLQAINDLRRIYARLTSNSDAPGDNVSDYVETVARAQQTIATAKKPAAMHPEDGGRYAP